MSDETDSAMKKKSEHRFLNRIAEKSGNASAAPVLIVALGDSVTQGCAADGVMDPEHVYHNELKKMLEKRFPNSVFSVINAGCSGESLPGGVARLERDVLRHDPDLVIVGYGLNDACAGTADSASDFGALLSSMVKKIRESNGADVILLTPNMMITHDNPAVAEKWRKSVGLFIGKQTDGTLDAYAAEIRRADADVADVYADWKRMENCRVDTTLLLSNGINHPNADMHRMAAEKIMEVVEGWK